MIVEIKPIDRQVVMQVIEEENNHGFLVPEQVQKKRLAKIVAVGPTTTQVMPGDEVVFRAQFATELELAGEKYLVAEESTLFCIVKETTNE